MLRLFDQVGEDAVPLPDNLALEEPMNCYYLRDIFIEFDIRIYV